MESDKAEANLDPQAAVQSMSEFNKLFNSLRNNDEFIPLAKFRDHWLPVWLPLLWPQIKNFPYRSDDVTIISFPKSGTHWLSFMVYLIETGSLDGILDRNQGALLEIPQPPFPSTLERLAANPKQRFLATHLPASLLPQDVFKGRVIYIYRNAKDTAVSYYYQHLGMSHGKEEWPFNSTFSQFARTFMSGKFLYGPYPEHVKGYAELQNEGKNILLLQYEDLKQDPKAVVCQVAEFLGKALSNEDVERILRLTSFEAMRLNEDFNCSKAKESGLWKKDIDFMRKGKVGDWRHHFTDQNLLFEFNKFIRDNLPAELIPPCDEDQ